MADRPKKKRARWIVLSVVAALIAFVAVVFVRYVDMNTAYYADDLERVVEAGITEKQVEVGGRLTNYAEGPDNGTPLLLIHGQGSQWQDSAKVLPELSTRYHVFSVDVYGHGQSARLKPAEYTNVIVGSLLAKFMKQVIAEPAIVSGHSSGGLLTTWIAANHPEQVLAVLLEDPPYFSSIMPRAQKTTGGGLAGLTHDFLAQDEETDFNRYFVENGASFGWLEGSLIDYSLNYLDEHPGEPLEIFFLPPMVNIFFRGIANYDPAFGATWYDNTWYEGFETEASLSAIECPATLIHTTYWFDNNGTYYSDGVLMAAMDDRDAAKAASLIEDIEVVQVSSGHLVHFEKPDDYLRAVDALAARIK